MAWSAESGRGRPQDGTSELRAAEQVNKEERGQKGSRQSESVFRRMLMAASFHLQIKEKNISLVVYHCLVHSRHSVHACSRPGIQLVAH
jgi:hypothetical protein